jgi:predicted metal-binding membrane protein
MSAPAPAAIAALERVVRRDRLVMLLALAVLVLLAATYLVRDAAAMQSMSAEMAMHAAMGMTMPHDWSAADWFGLFVMWAVMMVAMMLPSAAPVILLVLAMLRRRSDAHALLHAYTFVAGYLLIWTAFSAVAATAQFLLHQSTLLAMDMRLGTTALSGVVLLAGGVYQWLPVKNACLRHCRSPFDALSRYWREGTAGALRAGAHHGLYCVGCCWLMMSVLFVVGVMDLVWVAALAAVILVEKTVPQGKIVGRLAGVGLLAWGIWLLVGAPGIGR